MKAHSFTKIQIREQQRRILHASSLEIIVMTILKSGHCMSSNSSARSPQILVQQLSGFHMKLGVSIQGGSHPLIVPLA
jgi:hypothetical protein